MVTFDCVSPPLFIGKLRMAERRTGYFGSFQPGKVASSALIAGGPADQRPTGSRTVMEIYVANL